ncbi:RNA 3'-terminal phosphate cyclase-like protein [Dictyocoela roeselum]|nr:RNA 3'-terminal phosphate cyclase-like protein [Dictyocoela roeselum]
MLEFEESNFYIFAFSLLSRKNIKNKIHNKQNLLNFLEILTLISPDSKYEIFGNYVEFYPGQLIGGNIEFECDLMLLIPILLISPFMKKGINLKLKCQTNGIKSELEPKQDVCKLLGRVSKSRVYDGKAHAVGITSISADVVRLIYLPALKKFGVNCQLDIVKRDFGPGGEIRFICEKKEILSKIVLESHKIAKIRGIAISCRLNAIPVNTMVAVVREELKPLIKNTKVFTDMWNKNNSGSYPGYELVLFAENKQNVFYSLSRYIDTKYKGVNTTPVSDNPNDKNSCYSINSDDVIENNDKKDDGYKKRSGNKDIEQSALACIIDLMKSIKTSGSFDHKIVDFVLPLTVLSKGVSKIQIKNCKEKHSRILELLKMFFNFTYKIENDDWFVGYGIGYKG